MRLLPQLLGIAAATTLVSVVAGLLLGDILPPAGIAAVVGCIVVGGVIWGRRQHGRARESQP